MKQFIKIHPWRLEIVPALAFLISIGTALFYHFQLAEQWNITAVSNITNKSPYILFTWQIIILLCLWLLEIRINHQWIAGEDEKKFNYMAILFHFIIITKTFLLLTSISIIYSIINNSRLQIPWSWGTIVLVIGLCFTALMERTRKYLSFAEIPEPAPPADIKSSEESFCYNESEIDWLIAVVAILLAILSLLHLMFLHRHDHAIFGIIASVILVSFTYRKVSISTDGISFSCSLIRKRFNIGDIIDCQYIRPQVWHRPGSEHPRAICVTSGRCLQVTTRDGKKHVFGMLRPSLACSLIKPMIADNQDK